jgi:hypothetical protein
MAVAVRAGGGDLGVEQPQAGDGDLTGGGAIGWLRWSGDAIHAITLADIIYRNYYRLGDLGRSHPCHHIGRHHYRLDDLGRSICLGHWNACNLLWNLYVFCSVAFLEMDASKFQQHYPIFSHVCSVLQAAVY